MKYVIFYLVVINIMTFIFYGEDKKRAVEQEWRISEKKLLWLTAVGGSVGALAGMKCFRHKIKKRKFMIGVPALFLLHVLIGILIYFIK